MLQNYLKIALRHLLKYKTHSFINIAGLAIGMACCMLILLFIQDELSYDRFHEKGEHIYRLVEKAASGGKVVEESASAPFPVAPALRTDLPELAGVVRFFRLFQQTPVVSYNDTRFFEERFFFADSNLFQVFTFPLLKGDPNTVLNEPNSLVLTEAMASKYFGQDEPVGKTLLLNNKHAMKITGVLKNLPSNSHIKFDFLASFVGIENILTSSGTGPGWFKGWYWNPCYTYLLLPPSLAPGAFEEKLHPFVKKYFPDILKNETVLYLQPLTAIHLHSRLYNELEPNGDMTSVYVFAAIGLFILCIACINFMNLATARSATRAKEVGLRKALGAQRLQLAKQFLGESFSICFVAVLLALVLVELLLPAFNTLMHKELAAHYFGNGLIAISLVALLAFVGLLSGSYPALFLSAFRPIEVLKGKLQTGAKSPALRKALVIAQFAIAIALISGTGIIYTQLDYIRHRNLGFQKDQIVVVPIRGTVIKKECETFKQELRKNTSILAVSASSEVPGKMGGAQIKPFVPEGFTPEEPVQWSGIFVDHDFLKTYGIELKEGRDFSREFQTDLMAAHLLNEAAVKRLAWSSALEKKFGFSNRPGQVTPGRIIGVIKDLHYTSLHQLVEPLVISLVPSGFDYLSLKISANDVPATIKFIEQKWSEFVPERPFDYYFLDDAFDNLYKTEKTLGELAGYFTFLAILIACLGLFGLASFTAEQRTKEVGIRKVLGASIANLLLLLSKDFAKLVLVANVIAWPVAYYAMNKWLQNFAYRIEIGWWVFVLAGGLALLIALLTVSTQAIKAALANPVEALRYE